MVGGLLVAVAGIGTWWAATGGGTGSAKTYVVARHLIAPGQLIAANDLQLAPGDLPPSVRAESFTDVRELVGSVALGPIGRGELVQSAVAGDPAGLGTSSTELSFSVDAEWAVAGSLRPGDQVDVFATSDNGASSETERVLADTTIRRVASTGGDGLGERRGQVLTIGIDNPDRVDDVVDATRSAVITVVRVTGSTSIRQPREPATATPSNTTTITRPSR